MVVKARPPSPRIEGCAAVQRAQHRGGFRCPELLAGPDPAGRVVVTAETFVEGGEQPPRPALAVLSAEAFAWLVEIAPAPEDVPSLEPPPPWVRWGYSGPGLWPPADEGIADLNAGPRSWIDGAAECVRSGLSSADLPPVVAHADWWTANVLWEGERLHVVHDWDSAAAQPEAALAGEAAADFAATRVPGEEPTFDESLEFLDAYQGARGRRFSKRELQVAWSAGLWLRLFDAKKEEVAMGSGPRAARLRPELEQRLGAAGL